MDSTRVVNLTPGVYTLTATLTGFSTYKREGIELTGDFTATINIDLRVGAQEETITVTGAAPIVDVQGTQNQHVLSNDLVEALPTGKDYNNLGVLIPGVSSSCAASCQMGSSQDTGGSAGDSMSMLLVHGSRYRDTRVSVNNFIVTSNGGVMGVTGPNVEEMQETQIDTAGGDAISQAGGVRVNFVPKDGGNTYRGSMFLSGTNQNFQSNNIDQTLRNRGLTGVAGHVKDVYDIAPTFGGPIKKDALWFFLSYRYNNAENYVTNVYQNANKNNAAVFAYAPALNQQGVTSNPLPMAGARLTWQATARNKFAVSFDYRDRCICTNLDNGGNFGISPDASVDFRFRPQHYAIATWTSPVTNKLLLEAIAYRFIEGWGNRPSSEAADPSLLRVTAQNVPASFLGITTFRGAASNSNWTQYPYGSVGANATYVTGGHAFKAGFTWGSGHHDAWTTSQLSGPVTSMSINYAPSAAALANPAGTGVDTCAPNLLCLPNSFIVTNDPVLREARMRAQIGVFVQDKWTFKRLTLSGGVRFDYLNRDTPDQTLGPSPLAPTRNLSFPEYNATRYEDLSPRMGFAYDVFGNGKTAIKASLNRYINDLSLFNNVGGTPIQGYQSTASRTWTDSNHNLYPDCDFLNPAAQNNTATGGDICGPFTGASANFGTSTSTTVDDHNVDFGWFAGRTTGNSRPTYSKKSCPSTCRSTWTSSGAVTATSPSPTTR